MDAYNSLFLKMMSLLQDQGDPVKGETVAH